MNKILPIVALLFFVGTSGCAHGDTGRFSIRANSQAAYVREVYGMRPEADAVQSAMEKATERLQQFVGTSGRCYIVCEPALAKIVVIFVCNQHVASRLDGQTDNLVGVVIDAIYPPVELDRKVESKTSSRAEDVRP